MAGVLIACFMRGYAKSYLWALLAVVCPTLLDLGISFATTGWLASPHYLDHRYRIRWFVAALREFFVCAAYHPPPH